MEWEDDTTGVEWKNKIGQVGTLFELKAKDLKHSRSFQFHAKYKKSLKCPGSLGFKPMTFVLHVHVPVQLPCLYSPSMKPFN